jgi:putative transposase
MSQSLAKLYAHIVFSTKDRFPFLSNKNLKSELHAYIGGILRTLNSQPVVINGVTDHVHILCAFSKNHSISKVVGEIKRVSSIWIKTKDEKLSKFHWQDGYGAFSIGRSEIADVCTYIENQENHHTIKTFKDEYRKFLEEYEVEYDERYVWD